MSYPAFLNAVEGEQFNNYDAQRWPLGTRMMLQDGRRFVFAAAGGTALVAGNVQQSEVPDADHDTLAVQAAGVAGDRTISFTNGSDEIEADLYADGFVCTEAVAGVGEGRTYKIEITHGVLAASSTQVLPLAAGYGLATALDTSDTLTLIKNPYQDLIVCPAPPEALVAGIACSAIPADNWGWLQTWGPCACLVTGVEVIGGRVSASGTVTNTTGAIEATGVLITTTAATIAQMTEILEVGWCMEVAPTTGYGMIFLKIS